MAAIAPIAAAAATAPAATAFAATAAAETAAAQAKSKMCEITLSRYRGYKVARQSFSAQWDAVYGRGAKALKVTAKRQFNPDYVLTKIDRSGGYSYHILPEKLPVERIHMFVPNGTGELSAYVAAVYQTLIQKCTPRYADANTEFRVAYLTFDSDEFTHISIPLAFKSHCEALIAAAGFQVGLTVCSHGSVTQLRNKAATVTIPHAKHVIQFCPKRLRIESNELVDAKAVEANTKLYKELKDMDFIFKQTLTTS